MIQQVVIGIILSSAIAWVAYRRESLSLSGVFGAILSGTITVVAGAEWAILMIAFFVSSTLLSRLQNSKKTLAREQFSKGEQRDFWQVFANGGMATIAASLFILTNVDDLWLPYLAALAVATADTWATEIGTLSQQTPRSILNLKPVESGRSGGITFLGTGASLLGGLFIGILGAVAIEITDLEVGISTLSVIWWVMLAGLIGSLADSFLGATIQATYRCDDALTEKSICDDGTPAALHHGFQWINNDTVNFLATAILFALTWILL